MRALVSVILCFVCFTACSKTDGMGNLPKSPVIILFDNDVHCAVDGYAKMAAYKRQMYGYTPYVTTVSCGDFVQGDVLGAVSKGESIVDIMNVVGYDYVIAGNHEFDFGMGQIMNLNSKMNARMLCANFVSLITGENVFKPYDIVKYGNTEIAFIGFATPATATSVAVTTFCNADGERIYSFLPDEFYTNAQYWIDDARSSGADYVVALCHLGDEEDGVNPSSVAFASETSGVDVVLDGHSHSTIADSVILNNEGLPVLLASTGTKFENIGKLELSVDGKFTVSLVPTSGVGSDMGVQNFIDALEEDILMAGERVVGESMVELHAVGANGDWLVRNAEMPIGNFCADAFRHILGTDIAMINGGGIRASIAAGEVTFNTLLGVFPFNNAACTASITGSQLLDALEVAVRLMPKENGSFMHVSGLRFTVDISVDSPVLLDENGLYAGVESGVLRRVSNVEVLNGKSGMYEPVVPEKIYTLGGFDYNLKNLGSDGIFRDVKILSLDQGQDVEILENYLVNWLGGKIGPEYAKAEGRIMVKGE